MRIGVVFPHFEFGTDPAAIREYALTAEALGYAHIGADDHVIGPNPVRPGGWEGWVTYQTCIHEPLTLFCFMAAVTHRIEFSTCVLLLPQRQTVLAAKQAAELDVLSGGRVRLGLGNGWNQIEYQSLNEDFHTRGKRMEEQVTLMRQLWTKPHVSFDGAWHHIPDAGINPRPVQRPIPIWFGGQSEPVIRRVAHMGDGWMPLYATAEDARPGLDLLDRCLAAEGRTRASIGLEARVPYGIGDSALWSDLLAAWEAVGATHISLITTDFGLKGPQEHLHALERFAKLI